MVVSGSGGAAIDALGCRTTAKLAHIVGSYRAPKIAIVRGGSLARGNPSAYVAPLTQCAAAIVCCSTAWWGSVDCSYGRVAPHATVASRTEMGVCSGTSSSWPRLCATTIRVVVGCSDCRTSSVTSRSSSAAAVASAWKPSRASRSRRASSSVAAADPAIGPRTGPMVMRTPSSESDSELARVVIVPGVGADRVRAPPVNPPVIYRVGIPRTSRDVGRKQRCPAGWHQLD